VILERTLPAVWTLHGSDVPALAGVTSRSRETVLEDVEYLCAAIVHENAKGRALYALRTFAQMDEALAFLLGQVGTLLDRYDPTRGTQIHDPHTKGFRAWLYLELKRDLIDDCRSRYGRDGQKHDLIDMRPYQRAEEAERAAQLDQPDPNEDGVRSFEGRFIDSFGGLAQDDPDTWFDGRGWATERRDRKTARQKQAVGLGAPERAAGGDRVAVGAGLVTEQLPQDVRADALLDDDPDSFVVGRGWEPARQARGKARKAA